MNVLTMKKQIEIIASLTKGLSIRDTARQIGVHQDSAARLAFRVGQGCERLHDRLMQNLQVDLIELDEQWDFIKKKQKRVTATDPEEVGDVWLFIAFAAIEKAVLSYVIGKRTAACTNKLVLDLRSRIVNRPQITSDGYTPYIDAVDLAFDGRVDFGQLVKTYRVDKSDPEERPFLQKTIIAGSPEPKKISTSFVERFNLSTRMASRRFTRRTNGHSKTLRRHAAAVSMWIVYYNFCRVHQTLRTTPAVALGVADHTWSTAELIAAALASPLAPKPEPPKAGSMVPAASIPPTLRLIPGGKLTKK